MESWQVLRVLQQAPGILGVASLDQLSIAL